MDFLKSRFIGPEFTPEEEAEIQDIFEGRKNYNDISDKLFDKTLKKNVVFLPGSNVSDLFTGKIKSKPLELLDGLTEGSVKYYGNWGGPNYSSSRNFKRGEQLSKDDVFQPSQDGLDELYKQHDLRYTLAMSKDDAKERKKLLRDADVKFIRDAEKYLGSGKSTLKEKIYGYPSIKAFQAKLHFDLGYDVDQIPLDDSTENEIKKYIDFTDPTPKKSTEISEQKKNIDNFPKPMIQQNEMDENNILSELIENKNGLENLDSDDWEALFDIFADEE